MFEQLGGAEERYQAINDQLMDPNVVSDPKQYAQLMKEYKNLTPIVEKYREYKKAQEDMDEAKMMLEESGLEKDFRELIEEQYETSKKQIETIAEELKILLIPKDPNDDKNVIVEIRGGAGGDEAALFANSLFRMYSMYAESKGWKIEVLNSNPTELGGYKEVSFSINGDGAYSKFKFEVGRAPRSARARDRDPGPYPHLHRHCSGAAGGGRGRGGDQPQGPADRHLPFRRRRRPARQQDRVSYPHHPHPDRHWSSSARTSAASTRTRTRQ